MNTYRGYLEAEGNVRKIQKRTLFYYKAVKKGTASLTSPYVLSFFTVVLIKHIFEKKKSYRGQGPEFGLSFRVK